MRQTLIVMSRVPQAGRVKTRLGRDIGMVGAAWWFRHQNRALIRRLRDPRWRIVLSVTPDRAGMASRFWPKDIARIPQGRGDLGQRMARAISRVPAGRVCLVGADIPALGRQHVARAFAALGAHDAVFGPATDGGFWLIGVRHPRTLPRDAFGDVRWSGPHALADSLAGFGGLRVALADRLADIDTGADLHDTFAHDATAAP